MEIKTKQTRKACVRGPAKIDGQNQEVESDSARDASTEPFEGLHEDVRTDKIPGHPIIRSRISGRRCLPRFHFYEVKSLVGSALDRPAWTC